LAAQDTCVSMSDIFLDLGYTIDTANALAADNVVATCDCWTNSRLPYTCQLNDANPFDYLTQLQRHNEQVATSPELWMPWNYREVLT
jgi:hypothetical protein